MLGTSSYGTGYGSQEFNQMDHTKITLIVAMSVLAIILASCSSLMQSSDSPSTDSLGAQQNDASQTTEQQTNSGPGVVVAENSEVTYLVDANGCGGKDNTVWCASSQTCVKSGSCAAVQTSSYPPSGVSNSSNISN